MTAESIVAASPYAERIVTGGVVVLGAVLAGLWLLRRPETGSDLLERSERWLTLRRELAVLWTILAAALFMRTAGWSRPLTPPFFFAEMTTLSVGKMLSEGTLWQHWVRSFGNTQVGWEYDSVPMLPVVAAFQWLLGPRFHLPVLVGAVWGVGAVALSWALGRTAHSKMFGLVFAAMVAASPLQLMWSRLGRSARAGSSAFAPRFWSASISGEFFPTATPSWRAHVPRISPRLPARRGPDHLRGPPLRPLEEWRWHDLSQHVDRVDASSATRAATDAQGIPRRASSGPLRRRLTSNDRY